MAAPSIDMEDFSDLRMDEYIERLPTGIVRLPAEVGEEAGVEDSLARTDVGEDIEIGPDHFLIRSRGEEAGGGDAAGTLLPGTIDDAGEGAAASAASAGAPMCPSRRGRLLGILACATVLLAAALSAGLVTRRDGGGPSSATNSAIAVEYTQPEAPVEGPEPTYLPTTYLPTTYSPTPTPTLSPAGVISNDFKEEDTGPFRWRL